MSCAATLGQALPHLGARALAVERRLPPATRHQTRGGPRRGACAPAGRGRAAPLTTAPRAWRGGAQPGQGREAGRCRAGAFGGSAGFVPGGRAPEDIAKDLQIAFVRACVGTLEYPYVDALRDFVSVAQDAYLSGMTGPVLKMWLQAVSQRTGEAEIDEMFQRRPLDSAEVEMRSAWVQIVHTTLAEAGVKFGAACMLDPCSSPVPLAVQPPTPRMREFVVQVMRHACMGYDLQRLRLEQLLRGGARSDLEAAIFSQGLRLVLLTLDVCDFRCPQEWIDSEPPDAG